MAVNPVTWAVIRILTKRGRRHLNDLLSNCARANDVNRELLMRIVRDNQNTEYGRRYHFDRIHSVEDYKRLVPLSSYDDYAPYIERMVKNREKNLITAYPVIQYAKTSGSVGVPKRIPVSDRAMEIYTKYTITRVSALADRWQREHNHRKLPVGRGFNQLETDMPLDPAKCSEYAKVLEKNLEEVNPIYKECVETNKIAPAVMYLQQPQTHLLWRDLKVVKGVSTNQVKPVRVLDTPFKQKFFFSLLEKEN